MEKILLEKALQEKCTQLGYQLVSLSLVYNKAGGTLSLVVDRRENIDMKAIVELTHQLNEFLDAINPIEQAYTLDISSLGAEKPLKVEELSDYLDSYVHVQLKNPVDGNNIYEGSLVSQDENQIALSYMVKTRKKLVNIAKANITHIRLAIKF